MPRGIAVDPERKHRLQSEAAKLRWRERNEHITLLLDWADYTVNLLEPQMIPSRFARIVELVTNDERRTV